MILILIQIPIPIVFLILILILEAPQAALAELPPPLPPGMEAGGADGQDAMVRVLGLKARLGRYAAAQARCSGAAATSCKFAGSRGGSAGGLPGSATNHMQSPERSPKFQSRPAPLFLHVLHFSWTCAVVHSRRRGRSSR